jgi:putative pyruvate formate lyase activating enzyme
MDIGEGVMSISRRDFLKLLSLSGGAALLKACQLTDQKLPEYESPDKWLPVAIEHDGVPTDTLSPTPFETEDVSSWQPAYVKLEAEGKFAERIEQAYAILEECQLCPRRCGVNRLAGDKGFCRAPVNVKVHSYSAHYGEELPLVGFGGSGTIFFSNCNLRCVFCQNWPIAHEGWGKQISDDQLADMMFTLQNRGCHNINVVTPTHVMPHILNATRIAMQKGLHLPLTYNTSGYDSLESIKLLDGIVDIYLPDLKFMDGEQAERYNLAQAADYPQIAQQAIIEMHRQVGDLLTDENGIALRGLMIRHLVMPNRVAGTREFVKWVVENLSKETYVNIMAQYRVEYKAFEYEEIARAISAQEYVEAMDWAINAGMTNLDGRSLAQLEIKRTQLP